MVRGFEDRWRVWRLTAWAVAAGLILPLGSNLLAMLVPDTPISPGLESVATLFLGLAWFFAWLLPITIILNAITLVQAYSLVSHPIENQNVRRRIVFMWTFFCCSFVLSVALLIGVVMSVQHG